MVIGISLCRSRGRISLRTFVAHTKIWRILPTPHTPLFPEAHASRIPAYMMIRAHMGCPRSPPRPSRVRPFAQIVGAGSVGRRLSVLLGTSTWANVLPWSDAPRNSTPLFLRGPAWGPPRPVATVCCRASHPVLPSDRRTEGFLFLPTPDIDALIDHLVRQACTFRLLHQAVRVDWLAGSLLHPVVCALGRCHPPAVARLVAEFVLNPVQPHTRRAFSHICKKGVVTSPPFASLDASASVVTEGWMRRVRAPLPHR